MIRIYKNKEYIFTSLQQYVDEYCKDAPEGWFEYIEDWVNEGMNIKTDEDYKKYLKKMNLKWFDYEKVTSLYVHLKKSKYNKMFDDDILRYIAHIYGLEYFRRINYDLDTNNPNLDLWLNTKNIFKPNQDKIPDGEGFSLMELFSIKNGNNAIRYQLLFSSKW